eukprot:PhF_6_TR42393/c0_g1_i2/m.63951/K13238/DCI; 3,2-trans-enoyl-CoA isomerase, mitochondrial
MLTRSLTSVTSRIIPQCGTVAIITMNGNQQNVLDYDFLEALKAQFLAIESDKEIRGAILTSAHNVFSVGPDLRVLTNLEKNRYGYLKWYKSLVEVYRIMLSFKKPLVAAINGHCPSFACALVLACDERVMTPHSKASPNQKHKIGFIDTSIGLALPTWVLSHANAVMGPNAETVIRHGDMLMAEDALRVGLVDEVVSDELLLTAAMEAVRRHMVVPSISWLTTKMMMR